MNVSRVYTRNVIAVGRSTSLKEAARLMCGHHVGCLVVTEDPPFPRRAIGIVTDRDLVDGLAVELTDLARIVRQERSRETGPVFTELADPAP